MVTKTELTDLSNDLQLTFDKIVEISKDERSVMTSIDGYNESLGIILDTFEPRLASFRKRLAKIITNLPKKRRKRV